MREFTRDYLNRLARIRTPSSVTMEDHDECYDYCQLRNYAKYLLRDEKDETARERLSYLVVKLGVGVLH